MAASTLTVGNGTSQFAQAYIQMFQSQAATDSSGHRCLTRDGFVASLASSTANSEELARLGDLFDFMVPGSSATMSLGDFLSFQTLMERPDAPYAMLFRRFDPEETGLVKVEDIKNVLKKQFGLGTTQDWPELEQRYVLARRFGAKDTVTYLRFARRFSTKYNASAPICSLNT